jgi:hypothetical protein
MDSHQVFDHLSDRPGQTHRKVGTQSFRSEGPWGPSDSGVAGMDAFGHLVRSALRDPQWHFINSL